MAINYISEFSGQHNDDYDERITSLLSTIQTQQETIITLTNEITTLKNSLSSITARHTDTITSGWHGLSMFHSVNGCLHEIEIRGNIDKTFQVGTAYHIAYYSAFTQYSIPNYISAPEFNTGIHVRMYSNDTTYIYIDLIGGSIGQSAPFKVVFRYIK